MDRAPDLLARLADGALHVFRLAVPEIEAVSELVGEQVGFRGGPDRRDVVAPPADEAAVRASIHLVHEVDVDAAGLLAHGGRDQVPEFRGEVLRPN